MIIYRKDTDLKTASDIFTILCNYSLNLGEDIFEYGWYSFDMIEFVQWLYSCNIISYKKYKSININLELYEHECNYNEKGTLFNSPKKNKHSYYKLMQLISDFLFIQEKGKTIAIAQIHQHNAKKEVAITEIEKEIYLKIYNEYKSLSISEIQENINNKK